jgi:hypothetical protein
MAKTMTKIEIVSEKSPQEVRPFDKGRLELFNLSGSLIGRATFEPGWKWSECVGPIAKTPLCTAGHLGYQISGTMRIVDETGRQSLIKAGDFFSIPPGHDAWVEGDETVVVVDFQGMASYAKPSSGGGKPERQRKH